MIGNTPGGGSAASRFRPRGTAPALNRRSLLADEGTTQEPQTEEKSEQWQNSADTPTTAPEASTEPSATTEHVEASQPSATAWDGLEQTPPEAATGSTSTAPSPSKEPASPARTRGRPRGSTKSVDTPSSPPATDTGALSVSGARVRQKELENEMKTLRAQLSASIAALQNEYAIQEAELRSQYMACVDVILGG